MNNLWKQYNSKIILVLSISVWYMDILSTVFNNVIQIQVKASIKPSIDKSLRFLNWGTNFIENSIVFMWK